MTTPAPPAPIEVSGHAIMACLAAMRIVQDKAVRLMAGHGITPIDREAWYPLSSVLASLQSILVQIGPNTMKGVGRHLPDHVPFPSPIGSIEAAMRAIDIAYRASHRGPGDIGGYHYTSQGSREGRMVCDNPYPCQMDEGVIEAMAERFRPKDSFFVHIVHEQRQCRERGGTSCTYVVRW
ncbi:hypothetical protein [Stigmatella aurantiaca]|uniref:Conserved uncharacterized protein n=1 Tax=Stigmatella aurantiaca (strain DW4/3-1) TaxID=378806 RepID=Q092B6_STIAD|nr:hypothetical protein [Stigmatella aurantiaca]ADO75731.1 conserved uncharacterized protein [Stigmatella aurantiaca DW4/3-1]EAU66558.1 hypothetical protein STIAU_3434 [Stigmatella aurantiaca DW4/3-1]